MNGPNRELAAHVALALLRHLPEMKRGGFIPPAPGSATDGSAPLSTESRAVACAGHTSPLAIV